MRFYGRPEGRSEGSHEGRSEGRSEGSHEGRPEGAPGGTCRRVRVLVLCLREWRDAVDVPLGRGPFRSVTRATWFGVDGGVVGLGVGEGGDGVDVL